jgi:hypothetical protein
VPQDGLDYAQVDVLLSEQGVLPAAWQDSLNPYLPSVAGQAVIGHTKFTPTLRPALPMDRVRRVLRLRRRDTPRRRHHPQPPGRLNQAALTRASAQTSLADHVSVQDGSLGQRAQLPGGKTGVPVLLPLPAGCPGAQQQYVPSSPNLPRGTGTARASGAR